MTRIIQFTLILTLILTFFTSCDNGIDKSLIGNAVKLNSPYSNFSLYRYHIESSMAFGSGFTVVQIIPSDEKCDYTDREFYRFGNDYPFSIKWKNKDTITIKCIIDGGGLSVSQPIRKEIQKWKDWIFDVEYYSIFSTGRNIGSWNVENYKFSPHLISFKTKDDLLIFHNNEVLFELDSNQISIRQLKIDTFKTKTGLSLSNYEFDMNPEYKMSDFDRLQPFIKQKP